MSPQASCASEALVGAASTVSIGERMVVRPISVWSYLTAREVGVKDASTAAVPFDSSLSIIDAICSQTRGPFSIS